MNRGVLPILLSIALTASYTPLAWAADDSQLNFKIYSPEPSAAAPADTTTPQADKAAGDADQKSAPDAQAAQPNQAPAAQSDTNAAAPASASQPAAASPDSMPADAAAQTTSPTTDSTAGQTPASATSQTTGQTDDLKQEVPTSAPEPAKAATDSGKPADAVSTDAASKDTASTDAASKDATDASAASTTGDGQGKDKAQDASGSKVLQGYIRVVPKDTKVPIIMDTAVDSDTSQEGDEFAARTSEDLTIDGTVVVPAGSVIKGRIAQINAPKHLNRSGSVALKFDTITTPDNRQIPLVANLVARGGVVHAHRGMKDIAIDGLIWSAPTVVGLGIGAIAGAVSNSTTTNSNGTTSSSGIGMAGGALIGLGVGMALGTAIILAKKGKKIDVRAGDELKIQLAEDLRMPMM